MIWLGTQGCPARRGKFQFSMKHTKLFDAWMEIANKVEDE